jgi:hypothetical protein
MRLPEEFSIKMIKQAEKDKDKNKLLQFTPTYTKWAVQTALSLTGGAVNES